MKLLLLSLTALFLVASVSGQTMTRTPPPPAAPGGDASAQLQTLAKKIDEQNAKIDTLSQQILKLEQQLSNTRPGVMIGEGAPTPPPTSTTATSTSTPAPAAPAPAANGNSHVVARGETLTSIAKAHNVTATDLQKFNRIENDRKLQIGQTIMIPGSPTPAPSPSASAGE